MLSGCRPGAVRVAYRPVGGDKAAYLITVRSVSTLHVEGRADEHTDRTTRVRADHEVLSVGADGVRVQVVLRVEADRPQTVIVRLDRAEQLVGIEPVPGASTAGVDELGVAELFPAAAGAPPDRPLRPGERWHLDSPVVLPDSTPTRLVGTGRLDRLSDDGIGHRVATVVSQLRLPVVRRAESTTGRETVLEGVQITEVTTMHDLADGTVRAANATTAANYALRFLPPSGIERPPTLGTLELHITSTTERL